MSADVPEKAPAARTPLKRALWNVGLIVGSTLLTLFAVEGGSSAIVFVRDMWTKRAPPALPPYATRDTLLGWTSRAGFADPDAFGKGIGFAINGRGVRGTRVLTDSAPAGMVRLACSGDSFTIGLGVDDAHTWCARLEAELAGVQTINLGQAKYGLDQVRSRFERDGATFAPAVHLVALTHAELERALMTDVDGLAKGALSLEGGRGRVGVRGVPVVAPGGAIRLASSFTRAVDDLRLVQLARRARRPSARVDVQSGWPLIDGAIAAMQAEERQRGTSLALAYLPGLGDIAAGSADRVRTKLAESARALGMTFIDLTVPMRQLRADSQDLAFIATAPAGAAQSLVGQYSNIGNRWVARELAVQLRPLLPRALAPR